MRELVPGAPGRMVVNVFTVLWLTRIAMAAGRLRGLFVTVEVPGRRRIGFLYYTFFPVFGGASVHGYNLARELNRLGYELWKLNGDPDPWTVKKTEGIAGLASMFRHCEVIYVRMDYFFNLRNFSAVLAMLFRKKVIVELNSPSDELHLFGRGKTWIRRIDLFYRFILRRAGAVIVVSHEIETYCREALGLEHVTVIENGGEVFDVKEAGPLSDSRIEALQEQYRTVVIWSGSGNDMQQLGWVGDIARQLESDQALLLIVYGTGLNIPDLPESENIYLIKNPDRDTVSRLVRQADIGLAFYHDYPWSRWGFYNSSLKLQEYLVNGLVAVTNIDGSDSQRNHPAFHRAKDVPAVMEIISSWSRPDKPTSTTGRTWADVALDTERVIERVLNG